MKKLIILIPCLLAFVFIQAQFKAGDKVTIDVPYEGDLYTAGSTVDIYAPIYGDLVVAGGEISVSDSIHEDLLIAGGQISLLAAVKDDVRAAGGDITIHNYVGDDLLVFGGNIVVKQDAIIRGNLVVFGGNIKLDGKTLGDVYGYGGEIDITGSVGNNINIKGGNIRLNGDVNGSVIAAADNIDLGSNARIRGDFNYWTERGQLDINQDQVNGSVNYDSDLAFDSKPSPWWLGGMAVGLFFWYIFAAFLLLLVIQLVFGRQLKAASASLMIRIGENIGYGFLYVFGVPVIIVILFGLFIGIPIGLFILFLYAFSLLFSYSIASLLFVHHLNKQRAMNWAPIIIVLLALLVVFILRIITFIPVLGWLIGLLIVVWTYGSLINHYLKNRQPETTEK